MPGLIEKWRADPSLRLFCPGCRAEMYATLWAGDEIFCCKCQTWSRLAGDVLEAFWGKGAKITERASAPQPL